MGSNWYKYQNLDPSIRGMIMQKEKNQAMNERTYSENVIKQDIYPTAIIMRLGHSSSNQYNGKDTLKIYCDFCNKNHSVWFSTNSLASGMSEKKRSEFIGEIKNGNSVEMYFAIGRNSGGNNDIQYKAEVLDIKTDGDGIPSPEKTLTPDEWKNDKNKIWIKIKHLSPFTKLTTKDFVVVSSKKVLADSIAHSQYHFGYIKKK